VGPEEPVRQARVDLGPDPRVGDLQEAADVLRAILDQPLAQGEDVHAGPQSVSIL
jgi:hypothetical protein